MSLIWAVSTYADAASEAKNEKKVSSDKCNKFCDSMDAKGSQGDCCDGIWLPSLEFLNGQQKVRGMGLLLDAIQAAAAGLLSMRMPFHLACNKLMLAGR